MAGHMTSSVCHVTYHCMSCDYHVTTQDLWGDVEISWNYLEFEVRYESLSEEIKIGDYYLRLLLDEGETKAKFAKP